MPKVVFREVKALHLGCDPVANTLLAKFSCHGAAPLSVLMPAPIVFWLLRHIPVNQDPTLAPPPDGPPITQQDWKNLATPRALSVSCKQFQDAVRMTLELDRKPDVTLLFNRATLEMLRSYFETYAGKLMDIEIV